MEIKDLRGVSIDDLLQAFNDSFADYFVKIQLTKKHLEDDLLYDRMNLGYSAGAFDRDKLVGFIMHGARVVNGQKVIRNNGTGVVPEYRGNNLTEKMYRYIIPHLEKEKIARCYLEVISENVPAIKSYQKVGFNISRGLDCLDGTVKMTAEDEDVEFIDFENPDWDILETFWDWEPCWQYSIDAIEKAVKDYRFIKINLKGEFIGYGLINPLTKRVAQFAIKKEFRRQGYGRKLFEYLSSLSGGQLVTINIDNSDEGSLQFLNAMGLKPTLGQVEMVMKISAF